jgi:hypothetical protein
MVANYQHLDRASWGFIVWTVLKNAVGRDLSHITMPATINEPLSVLQKCAEEL